MADRPTVNGWNNINLNKPEEYSSEFTVDGNRYANVTNVTTGQRQLYFIQPLTNARGLLTTTNADGTVTKGGNYDNFVQFQGLTKLQNAEKANKQQSTKLLSTPEISTKDELAKIKDSKEFKSSLANVSTNGVEKVDLTDPNNSLFGTGEVKGNDAGLPGAGASPLKYPLDMSPRQDHIEFKMIEYSPRALTGATDQGGGTEISGFADRRNANTAGSKGTVVLPIVGGISDLNTTGWGSGDMSPIEAAAASVFLTGLKDGIGKSLENVQKQTESVTGSSQASGSVKTAVAAILTDQAINKAGTLSRTTGSIINPNTELLFNGVTLRPFTFNFRMSARSKAEADVIKKIIFFFKKGMAPKRTKQGLFIKSPNTFVLTYKNGAKDHDSMNKFKECALLSCSINYVPDGQYAAHSDGNLTSYEMQLQFTELEPVFFDEYDGKHSIGY